MHTVLREKERHIHSVAHRKVRFAGKKNPGRIQSKDDGGEGDFSQ